MKLLFLLTLLSFSIIAVDEVKIERYQVERDRESVMRILSDNADYLKYESLGKLLQSTTKKYIENPKYTTDVIRVSDKTVGFVNYIPFNQNILTFHMKCHGLVNMIGVDQNFRSKGYGKKLMDHAEDSLKKSNVQEINLFVKKENKIAQSLYEKQGFNCSLNAEVKNLLPMLPFKKETGIPVDILAHGNFIQQNPKIAATIAVAGLIGLKYRNKLIKF